MKIVIDSLILLLGIYTLQTPFFFVREKKGLFRRLNKVILVIYIAR